jgi:hypothetical protein
VELTLVDHEMERDSELQEQPEQPAQRYQSQQTIEQEVKQPLQSVPQ